MRSELGEGGGGGLKGIAVYKDWRENGADWKFIKKKKEKEMNILRKVNENNFCSHLL